MTQLPLTLYPIIMRIIYYLFILIFIAISYSYAQTQHGAIINASLFPAGYGTLNVPYSEGPAGSASTEPDEKNYMSSARKYAVSAGYFYNIYQADLNFTYVKIQNQRSNKSSVNDLGIIDGNAYFYNLRAGRRFFNPGDLSYSWIYFGIKHMRFTSSYEDIASSGTGYLVGFEGFYSWGLISALEFVFKCNIYLGTYRIVNFSSDQEFGSIKKKNSITTGIDLGIGLQYEPQNVTFLLKAGSDFDQIAYRSRLNGSDVDFGCRIQGNYLGFEIMYMIPNHKYNKIE